MMLRCVTVLAIVFGWLGGMNHAVRAEDGPRIDLSVTDCPLGEVIETLGTRAGVDVIVCPDVARPEEFAAIRLWLDGRGLPLRQALDWIARSIGSRYRYDPVGKAVWFTSAYAWVGKDTAPVDMVTLGGLVGDDGTRAFMDRLHEVFKTPDVFGQTYTLRIRPEDERLVSILPGVLQERLHALLETMSGVPLPLRAAGPDTEIDALRAGLAHPVVADYRAMPLLAVLSDIAGQSGINVACDRAAFIRNGKEPSITLSLGEKPAREVLEAVCSQVGLRRLVYDPPMAVWLTEESGSWDRTGSRELLWESVLAAGYDVSRFSRDPGGEAVAHLVRSGLSPDWRDDPSVGVVYQPVRHALIVSGPTRLQEAVERLLSGMGQAARP